MKPPKWLEKLVAALLPEEAREHVLGDLQERYCSPLRYLRDAASAIPCVLAGAIVRAGAPQLHLMELAIFAFCYTCAVWVTGSLDQHGWAAVTAAVVGKIALLLRDAYADANRRASLVTVVEASLIAFLVNAVALHGVLPAGAIASGGLASLLGVCAVRRAFLGAPSDAEPVTGTLAEIPDRARQFERRVRQRNRREYAGVLMMVTTVILVALRRPELMTGWWAALTVPGTIYVAYHLYTWGTPNRGPEQADPLVWLLHYRNELERQRKLLASVWLWYVAPLMPGMVAAIILAPAVSARSMLFRIITVGLIGGVSFLISFLNRRKARELQREIESLDGLYQRHAGIDGEHLPSH